MTPPVRPCSLLRTRAGLHGLPGAWPEQGRVQQAQSAGDGRFQPGAALQAVLPSGRARGLSPRALAVPVVLGQQLEGEELAVALLAAGLARRAEQGAAVAAVLQRAQLQLRAADPAHVAGAGGG